MALGNFAVGFAAFLSAGAIFIATTDFQPKPLTLVPPPKLTGALAPKLIKGGKKIAEGQIHGAESIEIVNGELYTCTADAKCLKIAKCGNVEKSIRLTSHTDCNGQSSKFAYCGRPLGIRQWSEGKFLVADSTYGIYAVDFENDTVELLFSAENKVGGFLQKLPDDLDNFDNDTIFYSDASTRWALADMTVAFMENGEDGRIIQLKLSTGEAKVLVDGLSFPNGVQIHPDRQSIIFAESVKGKIHRYYFTGAKKGRREIFCDNLPGFPDNIRLSASGNSFFVALFGARFKGRDSLFDKMAPKIFARKIFGLVLQYLPEFILEQIVHGSSAEYGIIVELNLEGKIIDSYHDPDAEIIHEITQVVDDGEKYLYLASFSNNYIGRILKH